MKRNEHMFVSWKKIAGQRKRERNRERERERERERYYLEAL